MIDGACFLFPDRYARSLSKTSRHSFSHTFPFLALPKSTPSFLAISSNDRLDGAGCFTFEEFGIGSEAEGF
jgi:hypothetical protein